MHEDEEEREDENARALSLYHMPAPVHDFDRLGRKKRSSTRININELCELAGGVWAALQRNLHAHARSGMAKACVDHHLMGREERKQLRDRAAAVVEAVALPLPLPLDARSIPLDDGDSGIGEREGGGQKKKQRI